MQVRPDTRARRPGRYRQVECDRNPRRQGKLQRSTILGLDDRQQQEAVRGAWLFEIADLAGMSKADVDKTKAFASRLSDRARPAYGRAVVALPRRCIFIATTNNETYLKSQTGNRRFWPVNTGQQVDLDALRYDRDQIWAEAAEVEASGAALKLPETLWATAAAEQDRRRDHDPWDEYLADVHGVICDVSDTSGIGQEERIATTELLSIYLKLPADKATDATAKRLSFCMRRLGWKGPDPIRIAGRQQRGYRRPIIK